MRNWSLVLVAGILLSGAAGAAFAQSSSPELGTWKLNTAKSKSANGPATGSQLTTIEAAGTAFKFTVDNVDAKGVKNHSTYTASYDGKEMPTVNSLQGDIVSMQIDKNDKNIIHRVFKKSGVVAITQTIVVSADGKTRTTTGSTGNISVYDKQ